MSRTLILRLRSELPFLVAVAAAIALRVLVTLAFWPGFVHSDGPGYLRMAEHLRPSPDRPSGYGAALWLLAQASHAVGTITVVQHLLGLVTAGVLYALLRRWAVPSWAATLGVLPVLLDQLQLVLEQTVLSDVLFVLLLVLAVTVLAWWRRPPLAAVAVAGLLLGAATLVRVVGEPTVLAGAVFCVLVGGPWSRRLLRVLVLAVCFVAPLAAYAGWFHEYQGDWALTHASGRSLYMRSTPFVDCSKVTLPADERPLCPREPLGQRLEPSKYGWDFRHTLPPLGIPRGGPTRPLFHDFGMRAIEAQPLDYLRTVGRDIALGFWPRRENEYEYGTAEKWSFHKYLDWHGNAKIRASYAAHGGEQLRVREPIARFLDDYDEIVYLPGPLLLALLVVALAGLVVRDGPGVPPSRPLIFLLVAIGMGEAIEPDFVVEFVWRYQLPAIVLVPPAAVLAWLRLRRRPRPQPVPVDAGEETRTRVDV